MPPRKKIKCTTGLASVVTASPLATEEQLTAATTNGEEKRRSVSTTVQAPTRRYLRGRLGGLKDMPGMPLDILIEIFSFMHPRDLLNLARTSKDFREFLMSPQSGPFWRAARQQVEGLPECPSFLSEPAYANLVFFPHCHNCLRVKPNVKVVMWEFLVRYCPKCKNVLVADPTSSWTLFDYVRRSTGLTDFINVHNGYTTRNSSCKRPQYHWPEIAQFQSTFNQEFTDSKAREEWLRQVLKDVKARKKFAADMRTWVTRQEMNRVIELDYLRELRVEAIRQRLRDEGWGRDLDSMLTWEKLEFSNIKGARISQKLTNHGWNIIRTHVVEYMGKVRQRRLAREREETLSKRFDTLSRVVKLCESRYIKCHRTAAADWLPTFADLVTQPGAFRDIMTTQSDESVIRQKTEDLPGTYVEAARTWLETRKEELNVVIRSQLQTSTSVGVTPHLLAIATWDCTRCSWRGMRWVQLLAHQCGRYWSYLSDPDQQYHRALVIFCVRLNLPPMWTMEAFRFNPLLYRMQAAIEACGEDYNTVTFAQMEACETRLVCRWCMQGKQSCSVFDWKTAVYHGTVDGVTAFVDKTPHIPSFQPLDAENAFRVRELEALRQQKPPESTHMFYGCTRCRSGRMRLEFIRAHCVSEHDVQDASLDEDYYIHTDSKPYLPEPIRIHSPALEGDPGIALEVEGGCAFFSSTPFAIPVISELSAYDCFYEELSLL